MRVPLLEGGIQRDFPERFKFAVSPVQKRQWHPRGQGAALGNRLHSFKPAKNHTKGKALHPPAEVPILLRTLDPSEAHLSLRPALV
jgi:hypothetical protein